MIKRFLLILYPLLLLVMPAAAYAEEVSVQKHEFSAEQETDYSSVRINEVMPNPDGSDTDYEWLEIYNDGEDEMDVSGCLVDDEEIPINTIIAGKGYLIVAKDLLDAQDADGQSFEQRWGDNSGVWGDADSEAYAAVRLSISLKNSDDSVIFTCGEYTSDITWADSTSGQSWSVNTDGEITDQYQVTPGRENEEIPPVVYLHHIQISEVYPSPHEDEQEWVELYNYGESVIDLDGWILEDATKSAILSGAVQPGTHFALDSSDISITLNNSGEELILYDPNEDAVDLFEYENTPRGMSSIRKWKKMKYAETTFQSQRVTKGKQNEYVDPDDVFYDCEMRTIRSVRDLSIGDRACIQGVVTVQMNVLGSKMLYLQDDTAGIQLYFTDEAIGKSLKFGDRINVFGELKETKGELKLSVSDENAIRKLHGGCSFVPAVVKTGNVNELFEGQYVLVRGKIVETSGKTFYIDDGSGKVKVLIKSSTEIDTPEKKKGQYAGIVGIVSQYGDDNDGYRVLPRYSTDIVISDKPLSTGEVLAVTGSSIGTYIVLGGLVVSLMMIGVGKEICGK